MTYSKYAEMASRHGIKIAEPVTSEILGKLNEQSEIFDLIWASQAAKNILSPTILSVNAIAEIRRLTDILLSHPAFDKTKYKNNSEELEKRADKHYSVDERHTLKRFMERQEKIRNKLGLDNAGNPKNDNKNTKTVHSSDAEIPSREEIEKVMRTIGREVRENVLKVEVEAYFVQQGRKLQAGWWEITKGNLIKWSNSNK